MHERVRILARERKGLAGLALTRASVAVRWVGTAYPWRREIPPRVLSWSQDCVSERQTPASRPYPGTTLRL